MHGGVYLRDFICGDNDELKALFADLSDEQLNQLNRGAHDPIKVYAAYDAAVKHKGQPTAILAQGVKGYGLGTKNAEGRNVAHNQLDMSEEELKAFRERFKLPLSDEQLTRFDFYKPDSKDPALTYLQTQREKLTTYLPARLAPSQPLKVPELAAFDAVLKGTGDRTMSTTMVLGRILNVARLTPLLVHLSSLSLEAAADRWRARLLSAPPAAVVFGARAFQLRPDWLERTVAELHDGGIPTFAYGDEPWARACDRVESDHDHGADALTAWLIARGARRILRCWAPGRPGTWQQRRDHGVERALMRAGLPILAHAPPLAGDGDLETRARLQAGALLDRLDEAGEGIALLAITDSEAFACARAAELLKRPVIVAGYDNYWRNRDELLLGARPPLASVDKRNREMGAALADLCPRPPGRGVPAGAPLRMMEPLLVPGLVRSPLMRAWRP